MKSLLLTAFILLLSVNAQAEESYLCISDNVIGFTQGKDGDWTRQGFQTNKYIVGKPSDDDMPLYRRYPFVVKEFGSTAINAWCEDGFSKNGDLSCTGFYEFRLNKNSLRFASAAFYGYFMPRNASGKRADDVSVEIGKCSPL
jgi:hypothetical protein